MIHPNTEIHLYLIRHGQSLMNLNPDLVGGRSKDTLLSQQGEDQATSLFKHFRKSGIRFDCVYCSPLDRAKMTANIALGQEIPLIIDDRLMEYSAGEWEGKDRNEVQTPDILRQMSEMGIDFCPPGGESQRQVIMRVSSWLHEAILDNQEIIESGKSASIAVFSHGLTIKCLLNYIMNFDDHLIWRIVIDNCSVSLFVFNARGWWPKYMNRIPY
ncbi:MAG: histidine phosphatase family protein [Patescibacteria group bacterium]|nr:histidine phosphatase family protein [Patescibacteria group bacterium]